MATTRSRLSAELHLSSNPKDRSADNLALQKIAPLIHQIRGERVILDSDLARIYGVSTTRLNEQVKRNAERFPEDFAFRLNKEELANLMSQFAISSPQPGGRRKPPLVFTEHGAIMAANVLKQHGSRADERVRRACVCEAARSPGHS